MDKDTAVYIVDDDASVRDSMAVLLSTAGLKARVYSSGREFLDDWSPGQRGCLVLDIRMPGMSGIELLETLFSKNIHIPVIIMTAHGDVKIAVRAMKLGALEFIEKPFNDEIMIESIREALRKDEHDVSRETQLRQYMEGLAQLTERERQVFNHLVQGDSNKTIATRLDISPRTVEIHRARVLEKLQVKNQAKLVKFAIKAGLG